MIILGVSNGHAAGACLVRNGLIVAAASEERFTRITNQQAWPTRAIEYVLAAGELRMGQVDYIAYGVVAGFDPQKHIDLLLDRVVYESRWNPAGLAKFKNEVAEIARTDGQIRDEFSAWVARHGLQGRVITLDHHECHALGAYLCSPFDTSLVITADSQGDFQSLTISLFEQGRVTVLQRESGIDSIGFFYGRITNLLGYEAGRDESRVLGLASYGDADKVLPLMQRMIGFDGEHIRATVGEYYSPNFETYSEHLKTLLASYRPEDVAAAVQRHSEDVLVAVIEANITRTGPVNICLGGGLFENSRLNRRIAEIGGVQGLYVQPCMGSAGMPLSAAVGAAYIKTGSRQRRPSMFLGCEAGDPTENLVAPRGSFGVMEYDRPHDVINSLVAALHRGSVVGLVSGRMEFGNRSLGHRTVICQAADADAKRWLNERLGRAAFMPFAPMTAEELASDSYIGWHPHDFSSEFGLFTYGCSESMALRCPAAVHIDGSAAPVIVPSTGEPFLHDLLMAWHRETDETALLSTSLHPPGEPMVLDAAGGLAALSTGLIDLLVLNETTLLWRCGDEERVAEADL